MKIVAACLLLFIVGCRCDITFSMSDVYAKLGADVVVPCNFSTTMEGVPTIKWSRVNDGRERLLYTYKRDDKSVTGSADRSDKFVVNDQGGLVIYSLTTTDDSTFKHLRCEVDFGEDNSAQGETTLNVFALAKQNPIVELINPPFQSGENIPIGTCQSDYAFPEPVVTFYKEGEENEDPGSEDLSPAESNDDFADFVEDILYDERPDGTVSVKKTLVRSLNKSDDNADFFCVVKSGVGDIVDKQKIAFPKFHVAYPTDSVHFVDPPELVVAGEDLELNCEANGYPEPTIILGGKKQSSISMKVDKSDDNSTITCTAKYSQDMTALSTSLTLNVIYADEPQIEGDDKALEYGDALSLMCMVMSKPAPSSTMWKKDEKVVSESGDYTVKSVTFGDAGVYKCEVSNKYDQLSRVAQSNPIEVRGLLIEDNAQPQMMAAKVGETVNFVCKVSGYPQPTISWYRKAIGSESPEEKVTGAETESMENGLYVSTLTVGPLEPTMSKMEFTCLASNDKEERKTFVLPELIEASSSTAAIIIGILVGIALIAILLVILYKRGMICNKKNEDGEEDAKDFSVKMNRDDPEAGQNLNDYTEKDQNEAAAKQEVPPDSQALINGAGDQ